MFRVFAWLYDQEDETKKWGDCLVMRYKLSDICSFRKGKVEVNSLNRGNYVSTENMLINKGGKTEASSLPNIALTQEFKKGDVLVSNIRPYFKKIWRAKCDGGCSNDVLVFQANVNINKGFLYYVLANDEFFNYSMMTSKGTKMPRGDKFAIMQYEVPNFDLNTQQKITRLLESIDEKIELNNAINDNLLEQALTMYATQFAALDRNGCIGDYCSVKSGFAFKSSWWTTTGVKVIKIGSISQDNLNLQVCSYVDEDKIDKAKDFIVNAGDLLIAMTGATIGKFAMVPYSSDTLLVNQRVGRFFLGNNPVEKLPFIYCTLKQPDVYYEMVNRGQGSAQPNISASDIMNIPCVIPSKEAINKFNETVQPLFDLILSNQRENQQLSTLRDSLLPRLMSGELDVSDNDL